MADSPPPPNSSHALRAGRRLEYLTLAWNVLEGVVAVGAGVLAGSTALVGFGADSFIESVSGAVMLWRLQDREGHEEREASALKLVAVSFFLLAGYVAFEAARSLLLREPPERSWPGIVIAALALVVMPWLARRKRAVAGQLGSRALVADSHQSDLCAWLSAILLAGLLLNALLGWWWADPVAALLMVPIIAHEGREAWEGEECGEGCP